MAYLVDVKSFLDWIACGGGPLWASNGLPGLYFALAINGQHKSVPYARFILNCERGEGAQNIRGITYLDSRLSCFRTWRMPKAGTPVRDVMSSFTASAGYRVIDRDWASEFLR